MSGIAGIFHRDGHALERARLVDMTDTMSHRGPDGVEHRVSGPMGMGHCLLRTLPPSREASQPLWDEPGEICLTLDGRIDNREELRLALGADARRLRSDTDAELLICAYRRLGTGCVARIVGEFSFALWDGRCQRLLCARDFLGKRPLYYHYDGSTLRWASEPQAVLADPSVGRKPNEGMIAEYLSADLRSTTETLFRDLFRLAPAHLLVVGADGLEISRYWRWTPAEPIHHRDERDYAAHLLALCAEAAEARLQAQSPPAVELSGGVDSSSLVGVVEHLRDRGRHVAPVETYSLVFPGRACDETDHIRAVARHCGVVSHEIEPVPVPAEPYEVQARRYLDLADYPTGMMHRPLYLAARERGCRVIFTGSGPDEWFTGSLYSYADSLRHLRLRRLGADVRSEAGVLGWGESLSQLWRFGLRQQAPAWIRHAVVTARGWTPCPPWMQDSFCRDSGLAERLPRVSILGESGAGQLDDGWRAHGTESAERGRASLGIEARDPFDDRRVVEFALALPEDQRRRGPVTKYVLREAMKGLIPESVCTRPDKADYSHVVREDLREQGGPKLFEDMALEDLGWVHGDRVREMYRAFEHDYSPHEGPKNGQHVWQLWLINSVERWLRVRTL